MRDPRRGAGAAGASVSGYVFTEDFPHFTEHARQHMEPEPGQDEVDAFELTVDLMLDGLERLRDQDFPSSG